MKSTNMIILIAALISMLKMVESATIEEQITEIIGLDDPNNPTLSETAANTILTTTTSETTLKEIYDKFLVRKKAIKDYIELPATSKDQKQKGYKALLLLLAAFETKKPKPTVTDAEKQRIVPGLLVITPGATDKSTMEGLLSTSSSLSNPPKEFTRTGTKPDYDMIDLLAATHRMRLHMLDPGTASTPQDIKNIRAIGRLTQLVNELIPTTTDYLEFSIEVARLIDTENKNPLLHYNPTAKNDLLELEREYAWRKTILDLSISGRQKPADNDDITRMNDANTKLQDEYNQLLPKAIKKVQDDFQKRDDSRKLSNVILSQMPTDPDVAAVLKERQRIDGILTATVTAPVKPDEEAALAIEEAFLYAKLDASDYAAASTVLTDAQKTTAREPAIHDAMNFRRLHIQKKYKEMLDDPTKEKSADKVQEKTKELKDKQAAFDPKTNNDDDINKAIDVAIRKIEDAAIQLFPPNPPPGPNPAPQPGPQPAPAPQQPQDPDVVKALDMEFDNNPPEKVPANQCQDVGTNCGDIMRMCGIPAYVLRMHQNCKKTCRACFPEGESCQDQFPADCKMWEAEGYCKSRIPKALKMVQCPVTCGLCPQ